MWGWCKNGQEMEKMKGNIEKQRDCNSNIAAVFTRTLTIIYHPKAYSRTTHDFLDSFVSSVLVAPWSFAPNEEKKREMNKTITRRYPNHFIISFHFLHIIFIFFWLPSVFVSQSLLLFSISAYAYNIHESFSWLALPLLRFLATPFYYPLNESLSI